MKGSDELIWLKCLGLETSVSSFVQSFINSSLFHDQQQKQQKNVRNTPNITNQDIRTTSTALLKRLYCYLQADFIPRFSASFADLKQVKASRLEQTIVTVLLQRCSEPL